MRTLRNLAFGTSFGLLVACGGGGGGGGTGIEPIPFPLPAFNAANFVVGVNHPLFPLVPGTTTTLEKSTDEGVEQVVGTVLATTKVILGVTCVIVHETVTLDGDLIEDTFDWFAQDTTGHVWYMGEDTTEFVNGLPVSTAGSFEAGVNGASAGIIMLAAPSVGLTYPLEVAPGIAEDMATVYALDQVVNTPYGLLTGCLKTRDFTPLEPGVAEFKFYAPGIGLVLEINDDDERNELISISP